MKRIDISNYVLTSGHTTLVKGIYNAVMDSYKKKKPFELVFDYNNMDYVYVGSASFDGSSAFGIPFLDWQNGTHSNLVIESNDGVSVED